jgi:membrane associated rhomboid family serine protease
MTMPAPPDLVPCYRHPGRLTGIRCTRCERPICPDCMIQAPVGHHCPACVHQGNRGVRQIQWKPSSPMNPSARPPVTPVVKALIAINVVAYVLTGVVHTAWENTYAQFPPAIALNGQVYRLLTAAFLHANVLHIGLNMFALLIFGPMVEMALGRNRFIALYLLAALGGSVCSYFFGPVLVEAVGASGAIFGVLGAWLPLSRSRRGDMVGISVLIGVNLLFSFSIPGIDWRAHVGGLVTGVVVGGLFGLAEHRPPAQRRAIEIGTCAAVLLLLALLVHVRTDQIKRLASL